MSRENKFAYGDNEIFRLLKLHLEPVVNLILNQEIDSNGTSKKSEESGKSSKSKRKDDSTDSPAKKKLCKPDDGKFLFKPIADSTKIDELKKPEEEKEKKGLKLKGIWHCPGKGCNIQRMTIKGQKNHLNVCKFLEQQQKDEITSELNTTSKK